MEKITWNEISEEKRDIILAVMMQDYDLFRSTDYASRRWNPLAAAAILAFELNLHSEESHPIIAELLKNESNESTQQR